MIMNRIAEGSPRLKVFRLIMVAILGVNLTNHFAPLLLLKGAPFLTQLKADQLQALALVSLKLYAQGFFIAMVFFWNPLLIDWIPDLQIGLPASDSGRADGDCWPVLPDPQFRALPLTRIGGPSVPLPHAPRLAGRTIADLVAPRDRRQRSTMEGAGQ